MYLCWHASRAILGSKLSGVSEVSVWVTDLCLQCCDAGRVQTIKWAAHRAGPSAAKTALSVFGRVLHNSPARDAVFSIFSRSLFSSSLLDACPACDSHLAANVVDRRYGARHRPTRASLQPMNTDRWAIFVSASSLHLSIRHGHAMSWSLMSCYARHISRCRLPSAILHVPME